MSLSLNRDAVLPRSTRSFKQLPFDLHCQSVQKLFCLQGYALKHFVVHKRLSAPSVARIRLQLLAATGQRGLMAVNISEEKNETVERMNEKDLI